MLQYYPQISFMLFSLAFIFLLIGLRSYKKSASEDFGPGLSEEIPGKSIRVFTFEGQGANWKVRITETISAFSKNKRNENFFDNYADEEFILEYIGSTPEYPGLIQYKYDGNISRGSGSVIFNPDIPLTISRSCSCSQSTTLELENSVFTFACEWNDNMKESFLLEHVNNEENA